MKLVVITNDAYKKEFLQKPLPVSVNVLFINQPLAIPADAHIIIDLLFDNNEDRWLLLKKHLPKPVLVNAVTITLQQMGPGFIRINAWPGFLHRNMVEYSAMPPQQPVAIDAFRQLEWKCQFVPDTCGMISARVIAMIVNEAYFTYGDGVSTQEEIDIAMKLGTNYPFGPFEWAKQIGLGLIYDLLQQLGKEDKRYEIAPALIKAIHEN